MLQSSIEVEDFVNIKAKDIQLTDDIYQTVYQGFKSIVDNGNYVYDPEYDTVLSKGKFAVKSIRSLRKYLFKYGTIKTYSNVEEVNEKSYVATLGELIKIFFSPSNSTSLSPSKKCVT